MPTSLRPAAGSPSRSRRCATACGGTGVEVWLETHGDFATATAARSLLEQAGGEGLGLVWDPANAFSEFGEEPEAAAGALGPLVRHVHLKDVRRPVDGRVPWPPVLPGTGDFPGARVLAWLVRASYDGWVSFEWEKRWHPEIEEPEVALPRFVGWAADELRARRDAAPPRTPASSRPAACASRSTRTGRRWAPRPQRSSRTRSARSSRATARPA